MTGRPHILLVDDNPDDRALVLRQLRKEYPQVQARAVLDAADLEQALADGQFDLVITDYRIRWIDGLSVLKAIKELYPHCPVIMFTGTGSEEIAVEAMKEGLDDYIIKKPSHLVRLRSAVRSVMQRAATQRHAGLVQARLETLLTKLSVAIFRCTLGGRLLEANEAFLSLTGFASLEEAQSIAFEHYLPAGEQAELLARLLESGKSQEHQTKLRCRDGSTVWVRLCETLSGNGQGESVIDGLMEDISQQKQAEQEAILCGQATARIAQLTPREREVMKLVAAGKPNKSIARQLDVSHKTIEMHRSKMMKKLRAGSVAEVVKLAMLAQPDTSLRE